jgi:FMN phosphatase YigB (HAD superfamily)
MSVLPIQQKRVELLFIALSPGAYYIKIRRLFVVGDYEFVSNTILLAKSASKHGWHGCCSCYAVNNNRNETSMMKPNNCQNATMRSGAARLTAIFDMDGTLIETDAANNAAYMIAARQVGGIRIAGFYGRITAGVFTQSIEGGRKTDVDVIVEAKVAAYCKQLWMARLGAAARDFECVLLNRECFNKVVLLTDSTERRTMETLKYFGMAGYFDEIVCNAGHGDKYMNYFNAYDTDPAASVVWENEEGKIQSALAAGVKVENTRKVG